jgi:hypothetical protein
MRTIAGAVEELYDLNNEILERNERISNSLFAIANLFKKQVDEIEEEFKERIEKDERTYRIAKKTAIGSGVALVICLASYVLFRRGL